MTEAIGLTIEHLLSFLALTVPSAVTAKTPAFFLAGDSTTAVDGGWGDGFLATLIEPSWGVNVAKSGATTASFEAGGYWEKITTLVADNADKFDCYVTISFGHNDQKPKNNVTFEVYQANLIRFANVVQELGGKPMLVSSLTRRNFESEHNATDSLANERMAAQVAADETGSPFINLNRASLDYINVIGEAAAHVYNGPDSPTDNTHLNSWGEKVFGRMVTDLVTRALPELECVFAKNRTMSDLIWAGQPA
ncbi:SGNH hydrolase-type esterase domain-containing protein [Microdochium bolleyi]|uniref:SGNH hydrolase-type esterase domain-containing protein n=1 Tax=Microdochium bolleyi TaxID=196109 RepID=A0A136IWB2_9PEZI|nr:SGNH hydrolase-type esterase domain-containing protein [Microdochium bolleyi]